jgi:hypothetical protein
LFVFQAKNNNLSETGQNNLSLKTNPEQHRKASKILQNQDCQNQITTQFIYAKGIKAI